MNKKTMKVLACIVLVTAIFMGWFMRTTTYLEWKIDRVEENLNHLFKTKTSEMQTLAEMILEASTEDNPLWRNEYNGNLPNNIETQWNDFLEQGSGCIDQVQVIHSLHFYPAGSCVFSHTIWQGDNIYAWVSLVFCPEIPKEKQQWYKSFKHSARINEDWYIVAVYGY